MSFVTPYVPIPANVDLNYNVPPNYLITIMSQNNPQSPLTSNMPASWQVGLHASWDQPFSKPLLDMASESSTTGGLLKPLTSAARLTSAVTGVSSTAQIMTTSVWQSGSPMTLEIPMTFRAFNDPIADVTNKIVQLMSMCAPGVNAQSGILTAPGPTLAKAGAAKIAGGVDLPDSLSGDIISVSLGSFMFFKSVIIESVSVEIHNMFDVNGNPLAATVNVGISTPTVVTKADLWDMFPNTTFIEQGAGGGATS